MPPRRRSASPAHERTPTLVLTESCDGGKVRYRAGPNSVLVAERVSGTFAPRWRAGSALRAAFLPAGYPASVRPEYLAFQFYDTLQAACSYLRAILTTSAILRASGVGEGSASPMAAAVAWVLRDGFGMCGSLIFASLVGSGFDENVKVS